MKKKSTTIILIIILIAGLSLLLYPTVANWWNSFHGTRAMLSYGDAVANLDAGEKERILTEAKNYNSELAEHGQYMILNDEKRKTYESMLRVGNEPVMGTLFIPRINVNLPIYHGTSESVLASGIGHLEWSSLPVGGAGTHCVLSGHRGLPSAKLLTDLDRIREGDTFTINVLDNVLTYEVDQIRTVIPEDTSELMIEEGKDYCTLVTCTPYGVNTHRLLVRGHRIENEFDTRVQNEALKLDSTLVAGAMAVIILTVLASMVLGNNKRKKLANKEVSGENGIISGGKDD